MAMAAKSPLERLAPEQIEEIGREFGQLHDEVFDDLGDRDAHYIRSMIALHRRLALGGRVLLLPSLFPPAWLAGAVVLSLAKILENMEIGHNVMHGQWDWMNDPVINSSEWDAPLYNLLLMAFFEWGVALHDLDFTAVRAGEKSWQDVVRGFGGVLGKARRQTVKDYIAWPQTYTFTPEQYESENDGGRYVRQLLGAANIDGSPLFHVISGNLGYQVEHHLYPDMPSTRYGEIAPRVREICQRYDLHYNTGPFLQQLAMVQRTILRLAFPGGKPRPKPDAYDRPRFRTSGEQQLAELAGAVSSSG